jgi:all-trans-retinol 13,14-reductase
MFLKKSFLTFFAVLLTGVFKPLKGKEFAELKKAKKVVIIGSGLTGLCSAAILAKQGYKVTVLEANSKYIGGHSRTYNIGGQHFCTGPQYTWNFGEGEIGNQILHYLNLEDQVRFIKMDENAFENFIIGSAKPIPIPMGLNKFEFTAINQYPESKSEIKLFFSILSDLSEASRIMERNGLYLLEKKGSIYNIIFNLKMQIHLKICMLKFSKFSLAELYDYCKLSGEVRQFLYGHSGIFAENQDEISAVLYAAGTGSYHSGAFVPEKGFESIVDALYNTIQMNNGLVLCGKTAIKIINNRKNATSVSCSDGSKYDCDIVFSNLSPRLTCQMINDCDVTQYHYKPSNTLISCFIVLHDSEEIRKALKLKNYWWQDNNHKVEYNEPDMLELPRMLYIGSPSANSSKIFQNTKDDSIVVFAPGNFEQAKQAKEQGDSFYQQLKSNIAANILTILDEKIFHGIKEKIVYVKIETPWDIFTMTGSENGSVYGKRLTAQSVLTNQLGTIKKIHNLYIGCATIGLPGVATCFRTASIICREISGYKIEK